MILLDCVFSFNSIEKKRKFFLVIWVKYYLRIIFMLNTFWGTKVRCMRDHSALPLRENPDHFMLHFGTNNLPKDPKSERIAK